MAEEYSELTPEELEKFWDESQMRPLDFTTQPLKNISTSATGGQKEVKRERMDLLPWAALREVSRVYEFGTHKYAAHNWRLGYEWSKSMAALARHFSQWAEGEDMDMETGESHLSSVVFHALSLLTWTHTHPEYDDRYKG